MQLNSKKRIAINAISSGIQVIIVGLVYFFLYRILLVKLGVKLLGVWSLVIATSSIANLANLGFTSGLVKFVAEYNAKEEFVKINKFLFTSFLFILVFFSLVIFLIFLLATFYIDKIVPPEFVKVTLSVLPYSLVCLLINSLGGIFTSALEGFQKNYIRNLAYIFTSAGYFILAILLLPDFGLKGLALAQIAQALVILFIAFYQVKKICPGFRILHWDWDRTVFKSLFNYGYKFQIISILQMLYEPVTKILISRFSGIATLGFYEMASKFVSQFRAIISTMNQVTVPVVAHYSHTDKTAIKYIYKRSMSFIVSLVFPLVAGIVLFIPHLSVLWIGKLEPVFINSSYILSFSMLINVLNAPAYFNSLGEGKLNGLLIMHILIAILNIFFGIILGKSIITYGVIIAWAFSMCSGSVFLIIYYHKENHIGFAEIFRKSENLIILSGLFFSVLSILLFTKVSLYLNFNLLSFFILLIIYVCCFTPLVFYSGNLNLLNIFGNKENKA
jgi:O-antigen/teichoic acid export membrane protein